MIYHFRSFVFIRLFVLISAHFEMLNILFAAVENRALKPEVGTGDGAKIFGNLISSWWGTAYVAAGVVFILYLMWGGLEWTMAGDNEDRVKSAKNKIQNAFFGLGLMAASWAIVKAAEALFGFSILDIDVSKLAPPPP